jgi:hypothetical protein
MTTTNTNQAPQSRTAEFGTGVQGETNPAGHASVLNEAVASPLMPFHAQGVLAPLQRFSGNGMSAQDNARKFVGAQEQVPSMPSFNGTAQPQQESVTALRVLAG